MKAGVIALLTDFGIRDAYVGIMKGVILNLNPSVRIVDLTHELDRFNILSATYLLYTAWDHFPKGTVFCAVVDPGVGSERRILVARDQKRVLVAPDNGLASLPLRLGPALETFELNPDPLSEYSRGPVSSTFHGRDLFAPAAALLARGEWSRIRGPELEPFVLDEVRVWVERESGKLQGRIIHQDRFGNCISSIHSKDLETFPLDSLRQVTAGKATLSGLHSTYSEVNRGEALALIGSSGFLEIAVREGSAAERIGLKPGDPLQVLFSCG